MEKNQISSIHSLTVAEWYSTFDRIERIETLKKVKVSLSPCIEFVLYPTDCKITKFVKVGGYN